MAKNKVITGQTPANVIGHQVRFDPSKFNELVYDKGYDIWHDKALVCPCSVQNAGSALPNCNNCLGIGFIFIDRTETRLVVQGMKADVRYENWTRDTAGMARITSRAVDKLGFMDRIVLKDVEGYYNEILRVKLDGENLVAFTIYGILEVESVFAFVSPKVALKPLEEIVDFEIDEDCETMLKFNPQAGIADGTTITIRYRHYQTYHIIDMNRDIVKVRTKGCSKPDEELQALPIAGMARKAHYLFDNKKYDENTRLIENTVMPPD